MTTLLTFGWFPFFFVFLGLFVSRCRDDFAKAPRIVSPESDVEATKDSERRRLWFSTAARQRIHLAVLIPVVMPCVSCGIWSWVQLGLTTWSIVFFAVAAVAAVAGFWAARYFVIEATYDDARVCSEMMWSEPSCLQWSEVTKFSFEYFTCCFVLHGNPATSSVVRRLRVSAFASGTRDFERVAREKLGESKTQTAMQQAHKKLTFIQGANA